MRQALRQSAQYRRQLLEAIRTHDARNAAHLYGVNRPTMPTPMRRLPIKSRYFVGDWSRG